MAVEKCQIFGIAYRAVARCLGLWGVSVLVAALLQGCSPSEDGTVRGPEEAQVPVVFSTTVSQRAETRAGAVGEVDDDRLRDLVTDAETQGFGVFAYHTDQTLWAAAQATAQPDFMYNQQVKWNDGLSDDYVTKWEYAPMKYWPNDFSTSGVDDQDDDTGNNPATGSQSGGRLSFFAYAPYVDVTVGTGAVTEKNAEDVLMNTWGICELTGNAQAGDPRLRYALNPDGAYIKDNVDVMWGVSATSAYQSVNATSRPTEGLPPVDLTKPSVGETVQLRFLHATSQLRLLVQGAFDEVSPGTQDVAEDTRILINKLTVTMQAPTSAWLNLDNTVANQARWETPISGDTETFKFELSKDDSNVEGKLRADIRNQADIRSYLSTASNFDLLLEGVTVTPKNVLNLPDSGDDADYGILFIPAATTVGNPATDAFGTTDHETLNWLNQVTVDIDYDVITRDAALVRNTPAGFSIINNHIHRTLQLTGEDAHFEANKKYTLRMILGMTTVKFDIVEVVDWETPITVNPLVREWKSITKEFDVLE
ncbi:MAG: hypothetical protein IJV06_08760 [Bacteroidaceae bacterium]|nr:hypothetical protein [Bacteroidaceae bacterium]